MTETTTATGRSRDTCGGPAERTRTLPFGSCRVHSPVQIAANEGLIANVYMDFRFPHQYFFHTVEENLQFLRILKSGSPPPAHLLPLVFYQGEFTPPVEGHSVLDSADVVLLEISSEKVYSIDDWVLQANQIQRALISRGGPAVQAWWRAVHVNVGEAAGALPGVIDEFERLGSPLGPELAAGLARLRLDRTDLQSTIEAFAKEIGLPLLVATHIDARGSDGNYIGARKRFIAEVVQACQDLDLPVFQPGVFVERFGQETVLLDEGKNTAEYADAFKATVGREYAAAVDALRGRLETRIDAN